MMRRKSILVKCDICDVEFYKYNSAVREHNFCSRKCYSSWKVHHPETYKHSLELGRKFGVKRQQIKQKRGKMVKCAYCGNEIYRKLSEINANKSGNFYCNSECMGNAWKGDKSPNRERMLKNPPMRNLESKCKMIQSLTGKFCGDKNPNWKGGISFGKYCPKFNETVKRDVRNKFNHKCFICGIDEDINGRKLDVHHVDYDKYQGCDGKKWVLVPLCRSCHSKTSSGNREYWNSYLVDKISLIGDKCGSVNGM